MSEFTCPLAVAVNPTRTVMVTPPPEGIERVCVEDADGNAESHAFAPRAFDTPQSVSLTTGADIVAMSVNAPWQTDTAPTTLPATGAGSALLVAAVAAVVVGGVARRWSR